MWGMRRRSIRCGGGTRTVLPLRCTLYKSWMRSNQKVALLLSQLSYSLHRVLM